MWMSVITGFRVPRTLQQAAPRVAVVGLLAWWWPSLTAGSDVTPDVLVAADAPLVADSNPLLRHLRERGLGVAVSDWTTWCDIDASVVTTRTVVISLATEGSCAAVPGDAVRRALDELHGKTTVLVVRSPFGSPSADGSSADGPSAGIDDAVTAAFERREIELADPSRLLGDAQTERQPCQWWDDCEPDGQVAVREPDGALTWAGLQRVARVASGALP